MTFTRSRTEQGRHRSSCDRCHATQASWTPTLLSRWQQTHRCHPTEVKAAPA